jgi:hypothetical protein
MGGLSVAKYEGGSNDFEQREYAKKGPRVAQLVGLVDVGIHVQEYGGEKKKPCRELIPVFKLIQDKYKDEEGVEHCMNASPYFGLGIMPGADRSKYMKFCEAIDPNHEVLQDGAGELPELLGRYCYVNMKHNEKKNDAGDTITYANYVDVSQLPEDYPVPEHEEFDKFFFDTENPEVDVFEKLFSRQKDLIAESVDYETSKVKAVCGGVAQDNKASDDAGEGAAEPKEGDDDCPY